MVQLISGPSAGYTTSYVQREREREREREEEKDLFLFYDALNTYYLQVYVIRHLVKDYWNEKRATFYN